MYIYFGEQMQMRLGRHEVEPIEEQSQPGGLERA
jgi:hypothetical protein